MTFIDEIVSRCIAIIMPKVAEMIHQSGGIAREGIIVKGTYDPTDGTASVLLGDTAAVFADEGDTPVVVPRIPIHTEGIGSQEGPLGDERVKLVPTPSGYVAMLVHGPDDSPGAAPGVKIIGSLASLLLIGAKTLNNANDAVMRKSDVDAALAAQVTRTKNEITAWAAAHLQGGTGASGPTMTAVTSTGSSKVKAAP
jgi:hypothetical protein